MHVHRERWDEMAPAPDSFAMECMVDPKTWERPYVVKPRKDVKAWVETPHRTQHYESKVSSAIRREYGWRRPMSDEGGGLRLEAEFSVHRPVRRSRKEIYSPVKPDIDNFARAFLEGFDFRAKTQEGDGKEGRRLSLVDMGSPIVAMALTKRWAERDEWGMTRFSVTHDGDDGMPFSPLMRGLSSPTPKGVVAFSDQNGVVRLVSGELPPAPDSYAAYYTEKPVPWHEPRFYGQMLGPDKRADAYAKAIRRRAMADYGLRKPIDGTLLLEVEVLLSPKSHDSRWMQWILLVDYVKILMDALVYRMKTPDGLQLGVFAQDSRVAALMATMRPAEPSERPGVKFAVSPMLGRETAERMFRHIETGRVL